MNRSSRLLKGVRRGAPRLEFVGMIFALACLLVIPGCFTRSPDFDPAESPAQREAAEQFVLGQAEVRWGFRRPRSNEKRPDYEDGFYMHVGGTTTCTGWLRKKQTTHVYAWVTQGSPTGSRVKAQQISAGFDYPVGFFKGAGVSRGAKAAFTVEAHDTISGYDGESVCQCVNIFGMARIRGRLFVRARDRICPDL